ncbi:7684_t:CDS:2 [Gigaspora rosea]|nr:7684_t:CDS:2 [Gigaspora rosea]
MDSSEIPLHLKKTLALLQHQMEKVKITGTYVISADTITYQNNLQSYPVSVENIKRENDTDRLHQKIFVVLCVVGKMAARV